MSQDARSGVSRRRFLLSTGAVGATAVAGCQEQTGGNGGDGSSSTDQGLSGEVIVKGSSTVFPISDRMAQEFMGEEEYSQVNVTVDSTGSGGGFENWFCAGDAALNGASRPITEGEQEQCSSNDVSPVEFQIAGDALTVAVNNDADWVDSITFEELSQIWREDGAQMWSDVRDDWPDQEFELFGPAETSGTYDWFNENVIGEDYRHTTSHQPTEEDEQIVQGIRDNPNGMGYFGYAYYNSNSEQVKALNVAAEAGDDPVAPSLANAQDGSYPMARPLFVYGAESDLQREDVSAFMEYYIENAATDIVEEVGYVPSSEDQRDENLTALDEAAGE